MTKGMADVHFRRALLGGILAAAVCAGAPTARANPNGATVSQGTATFHTQGSQLTIQTSSQAFINWQSFNIGQGETTTFVQPSSSSLVWNRINDANPSQILGNLNANGFVVLQNQSGFYIGGQASIAAHGLIMTTAPIPMPDLTAGGPWDFNSPPPAAKIINYGQINLDKGGSIFLIANDIENNGTISAPQGQIGLYAGKQVLVSERPNGLGLSAQVTLPQGSVDNTGKLIADAGTIAVHAQVVNQGGLVQANSMREVNGAIELVAGDSLTLTSTSVISAKGDGLGTSAGGSVTLKSGNTFADNAGSVIDVSGGAQGGNGGTVEVSAPQMSAIQSQILGGAQPGWQGGDLLVDPLNVLLTATTGSATSSGTVNAGDPPTTGTLSLNVSSFSTFSQIVVQALQNIELGTLWALADSTIPASLTLQAGNNIILDSNTGIRAGLNWAVNLMAGTALAPGTLPTTGNDSVLLNGNSFVQSQDGNITVSAPNAVTVGTGAIRTLGGGSINVTTQYGDVNTGTSTLGFTYNATPSTVAPFYYSVSPSLGGISTAAGGDVDITAGGNVTSFFPNASSGTIIAKADPGTGAFGPEPGNVTINAKGSIFGHYVLANGTGSLTALQNLGSPGQNVALSLVAGQWNLDAGGNIYLQEVRNPNGALDTPQSVNSPAYHFFDYAANATVDLTAGNGVFLTGQSLPRNNAAVPIIYPPIVDISAGAGGVNLQNSLILFPSVDQSLDISTSGGGSLTGVTVNGVLTKLSMSDSSQTRFVNLNTFGTLDDGSPPPQLNNPNPNPVEIDISGSIENLSLFTSEKTLLTVSGDMINSTFAGQNLHSGDTTSINVSGQIFNQSSFNSVFLMQDILVLPLADTPPDLVNNWKAILAAAVDPAKIASVTVPGDVSPSQYFNLYVAPALLLGNQLSSFFYNTTTRRLTFIGSMNATVAAELEQPLTVVKYGPDGNPLVVNGKIQTDTLTWVAPASIQSLFTATQGAPNLTSGTGAYQIGGPGEFDITAGSISLGNTLGIISYGSAITGNAIYTDLAPYLQSGAASIKVQVTGNLDLQSSTIATLAGGSVTVNSSGGSLDLGSQDLVDVESLITAQHAIALGIYSTGGGDVSVTALGDVNVDSSRIAAFNGGNVNVESFQGNVDAGNGGTQSIPVQVFFVNPITGLTGAYQEQVFASGIVAETLVESSQVPGSADVPGNITVTTPNGNIKASQGGILQEALNGNISAGPTVTLTAGTKGPPDIVGNVDLGDSGVIGGTVNVTATGNISGLVISRQSSTVTAEQNFTGTVLSGGSANVSATVGSVTGTIIGVGGATVTGGSGVGALVLGQNVSVNGGAATSTLGTTAAASSAATSASAAANDTAQAQVSGNSQDDDLKKKGKGGPLLARRIGRVTVILPKG
jgi:filamentous hemagglutinin family protein